MADAPKPITIKPITIKPVQTAAPAAPAAAPAAPAPAPSGIRPITINPAGTVGKSLASGSNTATIRLKPVSAAPIPTPSVAPAGLASPAAKGKTSRISLDDALAAPPTATATPVAMGKLTSNLTAEAIAASKGQTAKVNLTILDAAENTQHQTIRIKAGTPAAAPKPLTPPAAPAAAPKPEEAKPAADESEAPTVKRKSLVLKKAGGAAPSVSTKPTLKMKAEGADASAPAAAAPAAETAPAEAPASAGGAAFTMAPAKPEKVNVTFPIFAIFTIIALIVLSIMYMAECLGPDRSLTKYSYDLEGPDASWPGKIETSYRPF